MRCFVQYAQMLAALDYMASLDYSNGFADFLTEYREGSGSKRGPDHPFYQPPIATGFVTGVRKYF